MFRRQSSSLTNPLRRLLSLSTRLLASPSEKVRRAHALLDAGEFAEAAKLFGQLADLAVARKQSDRAGSLALQAAQAYFRCSDYPPAITRLQQGLRLLIENGHEWRASQILATLLAALRDQQQHAAVHALQTEFAALLDPIPAQATPPRPQPQGHLPTKCPHCGGQLNTDELAWLDVHHAECTYCGTIVKTA